MPGDYTLLTAGWALVPALMYSVALGKVDEYWDVRTQGLATDAPTTTGEKALLAVGVSMWLLWTLGFVVLVTVGALSP